MRYRCLLLRRHFRFRSSYRCSSWYGSDSCHDRARRLLRTVCHSADGDIEFDRNRHSAEYRIRCLRIHHRRIHCRYVHRRYRSWYPDGCCSCNRCSSCGKETQHSADAEEGNGKREMGCLQRCILGIPDAGYHPWRYLRKYFHSDRGSSRFCCVRSVRRNLYLQRNQNQRPVGSDGRLREDHRRHHADRSKCFPVLVCLHQIRYRAGSFRSARMLYRCKLCHVHLHSDHSSGLQGTWL